MQRLGLIAVSVMLLVLAACGGLPSNGQFGATVTKIGLSAGTDPASGGFDATLGYKNATMAYNPNTTGGKDAEDKEILSSRYGSTEDARAMLFWKNAEAGAGSDGGAVSFGDGFGTGPAAVIIACGLGNAAAGTTDDCLRLFE